MKTLLLDTVTWDLALNTSGNIAVASDPYSQAQDAASEIRLFRGELYFDTTQGIPYFNFLGYAQPLSLLKAYLNQQALKVPGVVSAQTFITSWADRVVRGQVQITNAAAQTSNAGF